MEINDFLNVIEFRQSQYETGHIRLMGYLKETRDSVNERAVGLPFAELTVDPKDVPVEFNTFYVSTDGGFVDRWLEQLEKSKQVEKVGTVRSDDVNTFAGEHVSAELTKCRLV